MLANGANYPANYPVTAASQPEVYALLRALARQEEVDGFSPEEGAVRKLITSHVVGSVSKLAEAA